jgi:hypothetical protein
LSHSCLLSNSFIKLLIYSCSCLFIQ